MCPFALLPVSEYETKNARKLITITSSKQIHRSENTLGMLNLKCFLFYILLDYSHIEKVNQKIKNCKRMHCYTNNNYFLAKVQKTFVHSKIVSKI